ncbi:MAG: acid phosphatase [Ferruginibacter sp.]|nr:acid phosphatase [Ferruginibacter sp.]
MICIKSHKRPNPIFEALFLKYLIAFLIVWTVPSSIVAQVAPAHIVIVILENRAYSQLRGNPLAPFINSLIVDPYTATLTQSYGLTHPSQPNYIHLFSGSDQGVTNNNLPVGLPFTAPNLGAALLQKGFGFTGYSEDLPSIGFTGEISGTYVRKHNPWVNWQDSPINGISASQNKPFTDFPTDYSTLPTVSFVIPNQNNDMHNGSLAQAIPLGDAWLQKNMGKYIEWCKTHNSIFLLSFDEDDGLHNNQVLTTITGEHIAAGNYNQPVTHYNILRTMEELYQLPYAGRSAGSLALQSIWKTVAVCNGASTTLMANLSGISYQWQVNEGNGFISVLDNSNYSSANKQALQLSNLPPAWNGYVYRCIVDGVYSNPQTIRLVNYWTGAVSSLWENPSNWSCGSLPDVNTDVIIHTNGSVILNSTVSVRSFTLSAGATFIQNSNRLTISR